MQSLDSYLASRPNFKRYTEAMNSSRGDKFEKIAPELLPYLSREFPTFLSIGAGTGVLEHAIAHLMGENSRVIALDLSLPMLETIHGTSEEKTLDRDEVWPVQADVLKLPFPKTPTFHAIFASSVIHEIASFEDNYQFGRRIRKMFRNFARILLPEGKLVIRDFVQPEDPEKRVILTVGEKQPGDPMSPQEFVKRYTQEAPWGVEIQEHNQDLSLTHAEAMEFLAHFSWARSFDEESKERYAYLPALEYAQFIVDAFAEAGRDSEIVTAESYLQPGYAEHINGRFSLHSAEGEPLSLPNFTGIISVQLRD